MATGWVKSLQCKSNAIDDVYIPKPSPSPSKKPLLPLSCGSSSHSLRDVVFLFPKPPKDPPPAPPQPYFSPPKPKPRPKQRPKSKPKTKPTSAPSSPAGPTSFPTLAELPPAHSSRRVVEIIFGSSWSRRGAPFPGEIEMLFRVHNPQRTVARFEDYRSAVRARAADDARCAADGNEMMRFHCGPPSPAAAGGDGIYDASVVCCAVAGKLDGIRTFAGSGGAHESAGGGPGRRAMLVCRVIAGRVRTESDPDSTGESVGLGKGELLVFDPRAVLPCFLIIYKI